MRWCVCECECDAINLNVILLIVSDCNIFILINWNKLDKLKRWPGVLGNCDAMKIINALKHVYFERVDMGTGQPLPNNNIQSNQCVIMSLGMIFAPGEHQQYNTSDRAIITVTTIQSSRRPKYHLWRLKTKISMEFQLWWLQMWLLVCSENLISATIELTYT